MAKYDFDNECWVCGIREKFNICEDCGCKIFIQMGETNSMAIFSYIKKHKPERWKEMLKYNKK